MYTRYAENNVNKEGKSTYQIVFQKICYFNFMKDSVELKYVLNIFLKNKSLL